jgi:ABC-type transport system involved in cytochrome c biogenesis permease component
MTTEIYLVIDREIRSFFRSGFASLFLLGVTTVVWAVFIFLQAGSGFGDHVFVWVLFLSMVLSAGFTNPVFIRERISGNLEILFLSGLKRSSILLGKSIFCWCMSTGIGTVALLFVYGISRIFAGGEFPFSGVLQAFVFLCGAGFLMVHSTAFFSLFIRRPRLIQFANFVILGCVSLFLPFIGRGAGQWSFWLFGGGLFFCGLIFLLGAYRLFLSEKIIEPIVY